MFDKERFNFALENYKKDFPTWWNDEKYKWEAVKCFQDNWNIEAVDFLSMLTRALSKTYNLLSSANNLPMQMVIEFARHNPEDIREMFEKLFDESKPVYSRIENFKKQSDVALQNYTNNSNARYRNNAKSHYQTERAITTYLWLKYPDKYYIYKFTEVQTVADFLRSDYYYSFKKGAYEENIKNFILLYDEVCAELKSQSYVTDMLKAQLSEFCYSDPELHTLTCDVLYYVAQHKNEFLNTGEKSQPENKISAEKNIEPYSAKDFLSEVFISAEKYDRLVSILNYKKNIILQGAPGVGKTFAAKRLAYSILGVKDDSKIEFVQFHQNYSYEDFVIGWRPTETNFKLQTGIFYNFCKKAAAEPAEKFFFIIDEINRGNLSKIFGELLMLIESDKRGKEKVKIPANGEIFSVPENLYIIGMMNTADRSLALIDYALRRRFSFIEFEPAFDSAGFKNYQSTLQNETFNKLIEQIKNLNAEISADKTLGKGFCIGHSYFCNLETCDEENLKTVVDCEILPTLEEYFFDSEEKFQNWSEKLRGVFNDKK